VYSKYKNITVTQQLVKHVCGRQSKRINPFRGSWLWGKCPRQFGKYQSNQKKREERNRRERSTWNGMGSERIGKVVEVQVQRREGKESSPHGDSG
jgi:hypothetical protein